MAIRKGWLKARWPIDETTEQFTERAKDAGVTLRDHALLAARKLVKSDNARSMGIGLRSIIAMEAQNQADEHRSEALVPPPGAGGATETIDQVRREMLATVPGPPEWFEPPTEGSND